MSTPAAGFARATAFPSDFPDANATMNGVFGSGPGFGVSTFGAGVDYHVNNNVTIGVSAGLVKGPATGSDGLRQNAAVDAISRSRCRRKTAIWRSRSCGRTAGSYQTQSLAAPASMCPPPKCPPPKCAPPKCAPPPMWPPPKCATAAAEMGSATAEVRYARLPPAVTAEGAVMKTAATEAATIEGAVAEAATVEAATEEAGALETAAADPAVRSWPGRLNLAVVIAQAAMSAAVTANPYPP